MKNSKILKKREKFLTLLTASISVSMHDLPDGQHHIFPVPLKVRDFEAMFGVQTLDLLLLVNYSATTLFEEVL